MVQQERSPLFIVVLIRESGNAFRYLLSRWLTIFLIAVVFGSLGVLYAWIQPNTYSASLRFSSEAGGDNALGGYAGLAAQFGLDLGGGTGSAFEGDNLIELLRSHKIVDQTLLSDAGALAPGKLMVDVYVQSHELNKGWNKDKKYSHVVFSKDQALHPDRIRDSIMQIIYKSVTEKLSVSKPDKKLNFVDVSFTDLNEPFAKDFVEELVDNATRYYIDYKSSKSRKNYQLITRATDSVRSLLYGNITNIASSQDLNVNPLRAIVRTSSQKIQVNAQANTALYTELLKQQGLAQIQLQKETPLINIIDHPVLPLKNGKKGRLGTGIIFAFFGGIFSCAFLLLRRWIKKEMSTSSVENNKMFSSSVA